jgi:toxin ParE1/3/4
MPGAGVTKWRLSGPAEAQLAHILTNSLQGWGNAGRDRYAALVIAAMQDVADQPDRMGSRQIEGALRIYHIRHSRRRPPDPADRVRRPRHIVVYETAIDGVVDILGLFYDGIPSELGIRRVLEGLM